MCGATSQILTIGKAVCANNLLSVLHNVGAFNLQQTITPSIIKLSSLESNGFPLLFNCYTFTNGSLNLNKFKL